MRKIYIFSIAALMFSTLALGLCYGQWGSKSETGTASGYEPGRTLYVCNTIAHDGVHPGKVVDGNCNIGYGGKEEIYSDYSVYMGPGQWYDKNDDICWYGSAVFGGYEPGRQLFVCLAAAHGGLHPGKVVDGNCNIGYGGQEEIYSDYYMLVE